MMDDHLMYVFLLAAGLLLGFSCGREYAHVIQKLDRKVIIEEVHDE